MKALGHWVACVFVPLLGSSMFLLKPPAQSRATSRDATEQTILHILQLGGDVERDEKTPGKPIVRVFFSASPVDAEGNHILRAGDNILEHLARFHELEEVDLSGIEVTGSGLKHLVRLRDSNPCGFAILR